jgi:nitrogen-specific signal transduction histidine kinase/CheY-like chemotaxis protein
MRSNGGSASAAVITFKDITERKRLEKQFLQSQKMEAIGRLAGGIAHDFNNLMAAIAFSAEWMLLKSEKDDPRNEKLQTILDTTERAARLTRQLLAFSRRQVVEPVWLDLNAIIGDMGTMIARLVGEDISFRAALEPGCGSVKADPVQIEQILLNLIVNAREAMPRGGTLHIRTDEVSLGVHDVGNPGGLEPGSYVRLSVIDTGEGIPPEKVESIFEPFYTTKDEGTGLGLSTVADIARQLGGRVAVGSSPGEGSSFTVYLPSKSGGEQASGVKKEERRALPGRGERVLLVEDDDTFRPVIVETLRDLGYEVTAVSSAAAAREGLSAADRPFALLITDVGLPDGKGPDIAELFKAHSPRGGVIFMSGYADALLGRDWQELGQAAFLAKPFSAAALAGKIRLACTAGEGV